MSRRKNFIILYILENVLSINKIFSKLASKIRFTLVPSRMIVLPIRISYTLYIHIYSTILSIHARVRAHIAHWDGWDVYVHGGERFITYVCRTEAAAVRQL